MPRPENAARVQVLFGADGVALAPEDGADLRLYGLMRNDMASLNAGKAVAQGMHAANKMAYAVRNSPDPNLRAMFAAWEGQAAGQGFGTTIVYEVDERTMRRAVEEARVVGLHAGIVTDDSYPLTDGGTTHLIRVDTCAFVFGPHLLSRAVLGKFGLMP